MNKKIHTNFLKTVKRHLLGGFGLAMLALLPHCAPAPAPEKATEAATAESESLTVLRQPAEYDVQEATWLLWSPVDHAQGYSNESVTLELVEALLPEQRVVVTASTPELFARAKRLLPANALESGRLQLLEIPAEELWMRDMGPNFVELTDGRKAIVDFNFNAWGYTPSDEMDDYTIRMEKYDELVADSLDLPLLHTEMISEGGNREVNGEGTLLVTETVEKGRNPDMSLAEMEAEFRRLLGVSNIIWLQEGLVEDDHTFLGPLDLGDGSKAYTVVTTNGHIDEFARFVNDTTILLAEVPEGERDSPIGQENHRRMEENFAILRKATDQDGKPFRIVRMPLPVLDVKTMRPGDSVYDYIATLDYKDGSTFTAGDPIKVIPAASYLNFVIANGLVIGQRYGTAGDAEAQSILQSVFPNRKVIMLDALSINLGGGGLHCISMHEPKI
ncbi:MAG: agmatine deiminase family protein [Bacteroidota bacterium]